MLLNQDDQDQSFATQKLNPSKTVSYRNGPIRWAVLAIACGIMIGSYFCYDFPAYLQSQLDSQVLPDDSSKEQSFQFNVLYTVYSLPNIILPLFGGLIVDILGIRVGLVLFTFILIVGQGICSIGGETNQYYWLVIGRFVFGLGGECLSVSQNTIVSKWFRNQEISFAMGSNISIARLSSVVSSVVYGPLYSASNSLFLPLFVGTLICLFSFGLAVILAIMDKRADVKEGIIDGGKVSEEDKAKLSDMKQFKLPFFLICLSCVLNYICLFPFLSNLQPILMKYYSLTENQSNPYMSIPYFMAAFITPFVGIFVDKWGKRAILMTGSSIVLVISQVLFLIFPSCPDQDCDYKFQIIFPLVIMGIFYSVFAAIIWPCVAIVSDPQITGTAFGFCSCCQNLGLTLMPLILGVIISNKTFQDYHNMMIFYICVGCLCVAVNYIIYVVDMRGGGLLNMSKKQKEDLLLQGDQSENNPSVVEDSSSPYAKDS